MSRPCAITSGKPGPLRLLDTLPSHVSAKQRNSHVSTDRHPIARGVEGDIALIESALLGIKDPARIPGFVIGPTQVQDLQSTDFSPALRTWAKIASGVARFARHGKQLDNSPRELVAVFRDLDNRSLGTGVRIKSGPTSIDIGCQCD